MEGILSAGIKVLALDWKRGYRDLVSRHKGLRVYTIGRDVAPFRFNPLIPPAGCEPHLWIKMIVDVIASAYLGGEGDLKDRLNRIVHRRNQIVHEGDVRRADRPQAVNLNDITAESTRADIEWLKGLVKAADRVVQDEL